MLKDSYVWLHTKLIYTKNVYKVLYYSTQNIA